MTQSLWDKMDEMKKNMTPDTVSLFKGLFGSKGFVETLMNSLDVTMDRIFITENSITGPIFSKLVSKLQ
tara:strand:+ start:372 stop:578 length:207 start_codon:yes stop_codon:yes gene_type:complete